MRQTTQNTAMAQNSNAISRVDFIERVKNAKVELRYTNMDQGVGVERGTTCLKGSRTNYLTIEGFETNVMYGGRVCVADGEVGLDRDEAFDTGWSVNIEACDCHVFAEKIIHENGDFLDSDEIENLIAKHTPADFFDLSHENDRFITDGYNGPDSIDDFEDLDRLMSEREMDGPEDTDDDFDIADDDSDDTGPRL